ncbi:MAG: ATP-dependent zinc protease [Prolixibacteraceae bacterium]
MSNQRIIIGRKDVADFESLQLYGIEVKIDTGAYTSSFHCHKIFRFNKNGEDWVSCNFLDPDHPKYHEKEFKFKVHKVRKVKSSNGAVEERIAIKTVITLFGRQFPIELTLTERTDMKHPVLLGRKFISKRFLVDTSQKNLSFRGEKINVRI